MTINSLHNPNILSESVIEELQRIFPDKFFIVGEQIIKEVNDKKNPNIKYEIDYDYKENVLTCFANQWEKIYKYLDEYEPTLLRQIKENITILDLGEIRGGNNKKLFGKEISKNLDLQLLSGGSMNLLTSKKGNKHLVLTTRDGGNVDQELLTGVAGRCENTNIDQESLKEFVEEGSYLGYVNGELNIIIPSVLHGKEEIEKFVNRFIENIKRNAVNNSKSTLSFLSEKYKPEDETLEKMFNKNFNDKIGDLEYSNLGEKLEEALSKGNILFYDIKEDKSKYNAIINIGNKTYEGYVFVDDKTTEFRKVYDINLEKVKNLKGEELDNQVNYIGRLNRPSTMFLESENQKPRTRNLNHNKPKPIDNKLVPATKAFVKEIIESE